ncbi:class I SAM-dependent methyltransferase [Nocardioides sp. S5]|uniref:class I SAM-dependent methyltransferase n=1 Tax=Nocardioides sp. S5 TaxID=2017486 RepID=UPI002413CDAA|nr:class I SAM-dependent methyltransferase [Nocardioides sp. S5]
MSSIERAFCRSGPWRWVAERYVLPWALDGVRPTGRVLEIGGGSGAMAQAMARGFPEATIIVTDVDDVMVRSASQLLRGMSNVRVERADVTGLPYDSASFDVVTSYLMLHHVIDWEKALVEAARTLRQGGLLVGYDLTSTALARLVHRLDGSPHRIISPVELTQGLDAAGLKDVAVRVSAQGHVMRFSAAK